MFGPLSSVEYSSVTHSFPTSHHHVLSLCFKLLRNLCAGEVVDLNSFLGLDGVVVVVLRILRAGFGSPSVGVYKRWKKREGDHD